ncbi:hypothetical protein [Halobacterium litoreum]|uniref:Gins51 C-terminal domain-containing protein n=1 Tax=Halobacterium litoreum TaxID=2039234 RepID=A0ABD5NCD8_9EURY|nr:hypothetical protein [Halobacterium litoreum]UHH14158.1 hypothetical protein LT972_03950 [Halobacterium litoreum]
MNLEDLRAAQTRERATDGLQDLRDSFYADVAEYIADLKERREDAAAAADDPFGDPEVQELTDKIETAEQVTEAIYERRMGKLVKQASLAAAGMPDDENGLTAEERDLYSDLVARIEANKAHVLDVISGDAESSHDEDANLEPTGSPDPTPDFDSSPSTESESSESSAAAAMGGGDPANDVGGSADASEPDAPAGEPPEEPPDAIAEDLARVQDEDGDDGTADAEGDTSADEDVSRTTVRMVDDVGEIFGVDERPYTLEAEDIVTLPEENAAPLVEKDAAEKLD